MAFTPSFTAIQVYSSPINLELTDTSSGNDAAIAGRRVYITNDAGEYVVPTGTTTNYILWPYANSSIDIPILTSDMALWARVSWVNVSGTELYSDEILKKFDYYSFTFLYSLSVQQAANNRFLADQNYFNNKSDMMVNEDDAANAVDIGSDIMSAQNALNRANYFVTYKQNFF